jgi:Domain of unknown function (DUF932)
MKLREAVRAASNDPQLRDMDGFILEPPNTVHYRSAHQFSVALKAQRDATAIIPADELKAINIKGEVQDTDWRLSPAAFSDLCHFSNIPVSFIKRLAVCAEQTALDVVRDMTKAVFHRGVQKKLIINTESKRIEGIVGEDGYEYLSNADALDFLLSASPELSLSNGWLSGPSMRATVINRQRPLEPKKGDYVHYGCDLENAVNGNRSLVVSEYVERLVCTNGAVARQGTAHIAIPHRDNVVDLAQKAVIRLSRSADQIFPLMQQATQHVMRAKEIDRVREFLRSPRNGGSDAFDNRMVKAAIAEAAGENREADEITLWNWHNAVTAEAKHASSLPRQVQLEATGYQMLQQFATYNTDN